MTPNQAYHNFLQIAFTVGIDTALVEAYRPFIENELRYATLRSDKRLKNVKFDFGKHEISYIIDKEQSIKEIKSAIVQGTMDEPKASKKHYKYLLKGEDRGLGFKMTKAAYLFAIDAPKATPPKRGSLDFDRDWTDINAKIYDDGYLKQLIS